MTDYVVYHKREKMGYPAIDIDNLAVYTSKGASKRKLKDHRVWVIAGEGSPRNYYLRATFRIGDVVSPDKPDFENKVIGTDGQLLDPMPSIGDELWFPQFIKKQGNFAFGFNPIDDSTVVSGLSAILLANTLRP